MSAKHLRILHTSDWHLGHKLTNLNRDTEQEAALDWLIQTIVEEKVDVLIVAGDIFDTYNPSVQAETMYYRFLAELIPTACRHVIITGGNHDSPAKLNAPKPLMDALKIHVVGHATQVPENEVIVFDGLDGKPELVVAAVPFLREQYLPLVEVGQSVDDRRASIRHAVRQHFDRVGEHAASLKLDVPFICMGHLCIGGEEITEEQSRIYLGDAQTMQASDFHPIFDYVALGHIHRAQKLNATGSVRYAGSMVQLSFSEAAQKKVVQIVDFKGGKLHKVTEMEVPLARKLVRIKCAMEQLPIELAKYASVDPAYPTWAEVIIESELPVPQLHQTLMEATEHLSLEILRHSNIARQNQTRHVEQLEQIAHLDPIDIFERKCRQDGYTDDEIIDLMEDFKALRGWMANNA
jgi:DNA repair protein SbcD/Mre11